jgi:hypothetical protein
MVPSTILVAGQPVLIRLHFRNLSDKVLENLGMGITFVSSARAHIFACSNEAVGAAIDVPPGDGYADCLIPKWILNAGRYAYHLYAGKPGVPVDFVRDAGAVDAEVGDYYGTGHLPGLGRREGVLVDYTWSTHRGAPAPVRESAQVGS